MLYETISYYLYTTATDVNTKRKLAQANKDIFFSLIGPITLIAVRSYLSSKTCFIPTASKKHTDYLIRKLRAGFGLSGYPKRHIKRLNDDLNIEGPCIIVGEYSDIAFLDSKVDVTLLYPIVNVDSLTKLSKITGSLILPLPCNSVPWFSDYMSKFVPEIERRTLSGYFQVVTQH